VEQARSKLGELKLKLDSEIAGLPAMPEFKSPKPRTNIKLTGQVPDFEARKITLENLKAKLTDLQATQTKNGKPNKAFFAEMQKTLEDSMSVEMVNFKMPQFSVKKAMQLKRALPVAAIVVKESRNIANFSEEMYRLHEIGTELHREILEGTRRDRLAMVQVIENVYQDMTQDVGKLSVHVSVRHLSNYSVYFSQFH
jgi:hypothetical protein